MADLRFGSDVMARAIRDVVRDGPQLVAIDRDDREVLLWAVRMLAGDMDGPVSLEFRRYVEQRLDALRQRPGVPRVLALQPERDAVGQFAAQSVADLRDGTINQAQFLARMRDAAESAAKGEK